MDDRSEMLLEVTNAVINGYSDEEILEALDPGDNITIEDIAQIRAENSNNNEER